MLILAFATLATSNLLESSELWSYLYRNEILRTRRMHVTSSKGIKQSSDQVNQFEAGELIVRFNINIWDFDRGRGVLVARPRHRSQRILRSKPVPTDDHRIWGTVLAKSNVVAKSPLPACAARTLGEVGSIPGVVLVI
ncbi:hypothetical protein AVEN_271552-1 [Araneus ventricosus]|uniref:Uncharacterized protein n=1 Tax=Araneus ventricosus TaxID=182803 RepID=A0A4Y2M575_ARAVE|nr:hypothetical protein AVEN_271552-1 [Araneus ventricosus]